jgi:hypothetical protein
MSQREIEPLIFREIQIFQVRELAGGVPKNGMRASPALRRFIPETVTASYRPLADRIGNVKIRAAVGRSPPKSWRRQ